MISNLKVLIIEDNDSDADLLQRELKKMDLILLLKLFKPAKHLKMRWTYFTRILYYPTIRFLHLTALQHSTLSSKNHLMFRLLLFRAL